MADPPITLSVLAQFHRDVIVPDMERMGQRIIDEMRREFNGQLDAIYKRFDRLEVEYQAIVSGLRRLEERLDRVEAGLREVVEAQQKLALKSDLETLKGRVDSLQAQIRAIEARLAG